MKKFICVSHGAVGFDDGSGHPLCLNLILDRLKQAGWQCTLKIKWELLRLGYKQSTANECVFIRRINSHINILIIYVDDLGVIADTNQQVTKVKVELKNSFQIQMTDLGPLTKILGLKIDWDCTEGTLKISQGPYIINILLDCFGMTGCHPTLTQMVPNAKLCTPGKSLLHLITEKLPDYWYGLH